jgi:hypothetical protein
MIKSRRVNGQNDQYFQEKQKYKRTFRRKIQGTRPIKLINPVEHEICLISANQYSLALEKICPDVNYFSKRGHVPGGGGGERGRMVTLLAGALTEVVIRRKGRGLETIATHYTVPSVTLLS